LIDFVYRKKNYSTNNKLILGAYVYREFVYSLISAYIGGTNIRYRTVNKSCVFRILKKLLLTKLVLMYAFV